jgi:hypothetical protein
MYKLSNYNYFVEDESKVSTVRHTSNITSSGANGRETVPGRGVHAVAFRLRAESPAIISTGQRPVDEMPRMQISPERAKSGYLTQCRPFRAMGTGSPLLTGRCPVLLMAGLSALSLTAMVWKPRRTKFFYH